MARAVAAIVLGVCLPALAQQQPAGLSPASPPDGASVGKKPRFLIRVDGGEIEKLKFRIEMSTDAFHTLAYTFDQARERNGWALTVLEDQSPGAVYFSRQELAGGDYVWRVASWDGLSWKESGDRFRLRIDDVPPADVDGVRLDREPGGACVHVWWKAVTVDRDGRPERVASYHVYRYATKGPTRPVRPYEAGETSSLEMEDCDPDAAGSRTLFYRVVAEDEAGNIAGRKF